MDLISMWEATSNERPQRPVLQGDDYCDVVVIGGGFSGLSTAYHLQQEQCKTIVLEQDQVGSGASGRNGGEVLTGYVAPMSALAKSKGLETAKQMWQLSLDAIDLTEQLINKHHIACDFKRNGDFSAAYKPAHLDEMKKEQEVMERDFNYKTSIIEKEDMKDELNTSFYHGGRVDKGSAHFHPLNYALGLANAVEEAGGLIYEQTEAIKVQRESLNKVIVETNQGRIFANDVVIVTNAYSGDLHQTIKRTIVPVESIMISTEPLSQELMDHLIKQDRAIHDSKRLLYYFRRTADNRMAFGGSGRASSKRDENNLFNNLQTGMINVFPELKDARIEYRWGGKVGFTKEMLPYVGQLADGTHFAFGFAGHGAAMSSMAGKLIANNIRHGDESNNPLKRDKLQPIPFHGQHTKAVGILKFYKRFLDRIS